MGTLYSLMPHTVWKAWATPKAKFSARLAIQDMIWTAEQDMIWTADWLAKCGWPNCGLCPPWKREQEYRCHLFYMCRFSIRLWNLVNEWLHLEHLDTSSWHIERTIKEGWIDRSEKNIQNRKAWASLSKLISWSIWNERNARIFRNKCTPAPILLNNIKL